MSTKKIQNHSSATKLLLSTALILFTSCSGGGGGDNNGGGGSTSNASTGVRMVHASLDLPPLDVYSAGQTVPAASAAFGDTVFYESLAAGAHTLNVTSANKPAELRYVYPTTIAEGGRKTVFVYGSSNLLGIRSALLDDARPTVVEGTAAVRGLHAALQAGKVKLVVGSTVISGGIDYGAASEYVGLPATGPTPFSVSRVSDGRVLTSGIIDLSNGSAYTILAAGEVNILVIGRVLSDS